MSDSHVYVPNCSYVSWSDLSASLVPNNLSFLSLNARSISNKFPELLGFLGYIRTHKFTFILITESWLTPGNDINFEIPGYKSVSMYRSVHSGGGIKLYYSDVVQISVVGEFTGEFESCESLLIKAHIAGVGALFVGCVYRPPNRSVPGFLKQLFETLTFINHRKAVFLGDYNINTAQNCSTTNNYVNLFSQFGYTKEVNVLTYTNPSSHDELSCLDHVWTNLIFDRCCYVVRPGLSDHYFVCFCIKKYLNSRARVVKFRDFSARNVNIFRRNMMSEFANCSPPHENSDEYARYFQNFCTVLCDKYFNIKTKEIFGKRLKSPWITREILKCINKKHRWHSLLRAGLLTATSYNEYVVKLRRLLKIAENSYYINRFNSLGHDISKNWKLLNRLMGRNPKSLSKNFLIDGVETSDEKNISEAFNDHFISHPQTIHESIPPSHRSFSELITPRINSMVLHPCTASEVEFVICGLKKNGSIKDVPLKFLKLCPTYISLHLATLFNMCINEGHFPSIFKVAKVTPIFKKGAAHLISNYRQISVLSNFSKIFESLLFTRIQNYFEKINVLSPNQFGFRAGRNTELAACELIHRVLPALSDKLFAICFFLDYSACFDTVSRDLLLGKLFKYGVRGSCYKFLESYFTDRKQYVLFGETSSTTKTQNLGVVQGSKTGPLFWDIYSSDFNSLCSDGENILYADDTVLVYVGGSIENLISHVNVRLELIYDWCNRNKLLVNPSKSKFMVVSNRNIPDNLVLKLGNDSINCVDSFKYLGVYIDSKLKFKDHIEHIESKLSQLAGVAYRLKYKLNLSAARNMYYACVYSIISYDIVVWGGVSLCSQRCSGLNRLHQRIVKNMFSRFLPLDAGCIFKYFRILKLSDIYKFRAATYMYKMLNKNQYPTLFNSIDVRSSTHRYPTSSSNSYVVPFPRTEGLRGNYPHQFIVIWNDVPESIKELGSFGSFKNKFIEYLIGFY